MKIWIIWSQESDFYITKLLEYTECDFEFFLDNRFGPWWAMSWEDGLERCNLMLSDPNVLECDYIILPPVYELNITLRAWYSSLRKKILPIFFEYCMKQLLPGSTVWKIACIGFENQQKEFALLWKYLVSSYKLQDKQKKNVHFQAHVPLYPIKTNHWSILYDLPRSWFIHKLIKTDLKKLKDFSVDSLFALERWYFRFSKVFKQSFHNKVRIHTQIDLQGIVKNKEIDISGSY